MSSNGAGPVTEEPSSAPARQPRVARLQAKFGGFRERIRGNPVLDAAWRGGIFMVGWLVVLGGVIMIAFPGPGWATIFLGFALLATEFVWARHALRTAKSVAQRAARRALDPEVRGRNQIIAGVVLVASVAGAILYVWAFGFGLPPAVPFVG